MSLPGHQLALLLLTGMGLGRLRPAPGTIGSFPPIALALMLAWLLGPRTSEGALSWTINVSLACMAGLFALMCLRFGALAEQRLARKDPPEVVADEIAGQAIALLFAPWRSGSDESVFVWNLALTGTAFVSFRVMDIAKPPPARGLQRLPTGQGILIDDLIAALYALIIAQLMARWIWPLVFH
jgi:phosphatidylglycerophosphatase A